MRERLLPIEKQRTKDLARGLKKVVEDWVELSNAGETIEGLDEADVRNSEKSVVGGLIKHLKNNPAESNDPEIKFVIEEYLRIGDCIDLMTEIAELVGLKYYDPLTMDERPEGAIGPDLAAESFANELERMGETDSNVAERYKEDTENPKKGDNNKLN